MKKKFIYLPVMLLFLFVLTACGKKELKDFTISVDSLMPINTTKQVRVTYDPEDVQETITWSSSDSEIAEVNDGIVKAKNVGNVTIIAQTAGGLRKTANIEVYKKVESLTLSKESVELYAGESTDITAEVLPDDATYKEITWTSSNSNVANVDGGKIIAKNVGSTTIVAKTKDGVSKQCNVLVKEKPIEYSGSGDKIISNIRIPSGNYKAVLSNSGRSNFIVKFYENSNDSYGDLLANEIGTYNGSVVIRDGETSLISDGMLEIKSSGKWTIKFEPISGTIQGKTVSGTGDVVTGWFKGDGKRQVATFTNSGKSNFIVRIYDEYGDRDLLVNEIGSYNGQATFTTNSYSKYYFEVVSSGKWTISWE